MYKCEMAEGTHQTLNIAVTKAGEVVFAKSCSTPEEFQEYMERVIEDFVPLTIKDYRTKR